MRAVVFQYIKWTVIREYNFTRASSSEHERHEGGKLTVQPFEIHWCIRKQNKQNSSDVGIKSEIVSINSSLKLTEWICSFSIYYFVVRYICLSGMVYSTPIQIDVCIFICLEYYWKTKIQNSGCLLSGPDISLGAKGF